MQVFILLCLAAASLALPSDPNLAQEWTSFKARYSKSYSPEQEVERRAIWEHHVQLIQQHNLEADSGQHTYWLGQNQFADLTNSEFRRTNGYRPSKYPSGAQRVFSASVAALPDTVDWRARGYVNGVKNQGQCGSCWAFSSTGSLEGQHFKKSGKLVSLSEQNLVDCSGKEGNNGCEGGLMDNAFRYIKKNDGIDTEASYPYTAKDGKQCLFKRQDVGATLTGHVDVAKGDEQALKAAVASVGPISVAIDASHPSFQLYKSGVYTEMKCSSTQLDHGVLAVGYGTEGGQDYWLVKNSWGAAWGMQGYIHMARNKQNMCGIATAASYPLV